MNYTKAALSFAEQADLLIGRGLAAERAQLISTLERVSYYRLSGYWHPFRQADDTFAPGTTLEQVWRRYTFDRQLRLLVMDAVERVEVAVLRTRMVEHHARQYGPFGYVHAAAFRPEFSQPDNYGVVPRDRMLDEIDRATGQSREAFVAHFRAKYTSERDLPLWMAAEVASFGTLLTFFRYLNHAESRQLAAAYGLPGKVLQSWLFSLNYIRNLCAHHARLWNRELSIKPLIPQNDPQWQVPAPPDNRRVYAVLCLLRAMQRHIAPQSGWHQRLGQLLAQYPDVPAAAMGFVAGWEHSPLWN